MLLHTALNKKFMQESTDERVLKVVEVTMEHQMSNVDLYSAFS